MELSHIGNRIRARRTALGLTQDAFARKLEVTPQAVSKWETGAGCPDIGLLPKIAKTLGISMDQLFGMEPMPELSPDSAEPLRTVPEDAEILSAAEDAIRQMEREMEQEEARLAHEHAMPVPKAPELTPVHTFHRVRCLSDRQPSCIEGPRVIWPDGSYADLAEKRVVNFGEFRIQLQEAAESCWDSAESCWDSAESYSDSAGFGEESTRRGEYHAPAGSRSFVDPDFARNISRMVQDAVREAMSEGRSAIRQAKSAVREGLDAAMSGVSAAHAPGEGSSANVDSLRLRLWGSADAEVVPGSEGTWRVTVDGSPRLASAIHWTVENGMLKVWNDPTLSGESGTVRIETGFGQGRSLECSVHGSGDLDCAVAFAQSRIGVYGSGDLTLGFVGDCTASLCGSGDVQCAGADTLRLQLSGNGDFTCGPVHGDVTVRQSGNGNCTLAQMLGQTLAVYLSGSADFTCRDVSCREIRLFCSGAGDFLLGGEAENLTVQASGACDLLGDRLRVQNATFTGSGSLNAVLYDVHGRLEVPKDACFDVNVLRKS